MMIPYVKITFFAPITLQDQRSSDHLVQSKRVDHKGRAFEVYLFKGGLNIRVYNPNGVAFTIIIVSLGRE